ncbi:hypothetical protein, conserved, partial [Trypanosoma vivax Y486]
MRLVLK